MSLLLINESLWKHFGDFTYCGLLNTFVKRNERHHVPLMIIFYCTILAQQSIHMNTTTCI